VSKSVLIGRPKTHQALRCKGKIAPPVLDMAVPSVMGEPAIGFDDQPPLDKQVDTPHPGNIHLWLAGKPRAANHQTKDRLLPRLGSTIDSCPQILQAAGHPSKERIDLRFGDALQKECIVDGRDSELRVLTSEYLGQRIDCAHCDIGCDRSKKQRTPVQLGTVAVVRRKAGCSLCWGSHPRHRHFDMNVRPEGRHSENTLTQKRGNAGDPATDANGSNDVGMCRRQEVMVAAGANQVATTHSSGQATFGCPKGKQLCTSEHHFAARGERRLPSHLSILLRGRSAPQAPRRSVDSVDARRPVHNSCKSRAPAGNS
jgi:hypothetical protein